MRKKSILFVLFLMFLLQDINAQTTTDSLQLKKEYVSLQEALKNPEKVYRLNLSNQTFMIADSTWLKFPNVEYLSFKNDHLKKIPSGIGYLKNLKVLDLSGNDFKTLPPSFTNLTSLQELYLNDDKNLQLKKTIPILSQLPNLRSLHLENDGLIKLPNNIFRLTRLESLYLNNNQFKQVPSEIKGLKNLKYLDFHDNKYNLNLNQNQNFGIKIGF